MSLCHSSPNDVKYTVCLSSVDDIHRTSSTLSVFSLLAKITLCSFIESIYDKTFVKEVNVQHKIPVVTALCASELFGGFNFC